MPGTLYLTVKIPKPLPYAPLPEPGKRPEKPTPLDFQKYCFNGTYGDGAEEFEWGLYLHRERKNGIAGRWYTLRSSPSNYEDGKPEYTLNARDMPHSPQVVHYVVCLIRILEVPVEIIPRVISFMDRMGPKFISRAHTSYLWAASLYVRTRRYVGAKLRLVDPVTESFDYEVFFKEHLEFIDDEYWYARMRQLPRPIVTSSVGVKMLSDGQTETKESMADPVEDGL